MIHEHNEIEAKLAADEVLVSDFCKLMFAQMPTKYECVTGPDTYYRQGENVIRHREKKNSKTHELTVKRRKSTKSTRDREEIDLHFAHNTGVLDVRAFLAATGFEKEFQLVKTAHIFG
jgi:adenylate cyclase class IV